MQDNVLDYITETDRTADSVPERIATRLRVLRQWDKDRRVPPGKAVPKNLVAARLWHDVELGIYPIKSPNEFTTVHETYGDDVREVQTLSLRLSAVAPVFDAKGKVKGARNAGDDMTYVISQWHKERAEALMQKSRANRNEAHLELATAELKRKDAEIAALTRQLAAKKGPTVVE